MSDDEACIMLSPIESEYHTSDSVEIDADCGHRCWIGPTSKAAVDDPDIEVTTMCTPCLMSNPEYRKSLLDDLMGDGLRALPGVREELNREIGTEDTDRIYENLRVREERP